MLSPLYYNDYPNDGKEYSFGYPGGDDLAPDDQLHVLSNRTRQWFTER